MSLYEQLLDLLRENPLVKEHWTVERKTVDQETVTTQAVIASGAKQSPTSKLEIASAQTARLAMTPRAEQFQETFSFKIRARITETLTLQIRYLQDGGFVRCEESVTL
jgi:hypothetical protein